MSLTRPVNTTQTLVNEELKQYFRPEFLNRLDEIIVFRQLSKAEVKEIADIMLKDVRPCPEIHIMCISGAFNAFCQYVRHDFSAPTRSKILVRSPAVHPRGMQWHM